MENVQKAAGSQGPTSQEKTSDSHQDALPPLPPGRGRGNRGRGRGKKDKSEQDSAYSSGSQAKRRADESHPQPTTPTTTSGDEAKSNQYHMDVMQAPISPGHQAKAKAQSLATLSEALDFVDQCRKSSLWQNMEKQKSLTNMATSLMASPEPVPGTSSDVQVEQEQEQIAESMEPDDADQTRFCAAVSLNDGLVQHTTNFCSNEMGYPADMWIGRSILDFIHIEDRDLFSSFVTENIHLEMVGNAKISFCVRIRQYNGLRSGFTVKRRKTRYNTFKVSTFFRGLQNSENQSPPSVTYLFITAEPIRCAYKTPLEVGPVTTTGGKNFFSTQHKADCTLSWLDESAISFTGYITQHILGHSILEFIHPSDLTILKKIFEKLVDTRGQPGHSEAVRMRTQNRSYISLNSTWSSFINPWTQKLEFVMGKHTVLLGPEDIEDFFSSSLNTLKGLSAQGQAIQEDIRKCLTKALKVPTTSTTTESRKQDVLIQSLMGNILKDSKSGSKPPPPTPTQMPAPFLSWKPPMHPSTVPGMLFSDTESAPNYTQLNYKENITRYFNSQPRTHTETKTKEDFFPVNVNISSDPSKESPKRQKLSGKRRSGSGSKSSVSDSGSGSKPTSPKSTKTLSPTSSQPQTDRADRPSNRQPITVEMMAQHNEDMEKEMKEKFKVSRVTSDQRFIMHRAPCPMVTATVTTPSVALMSVPIPEELLPPLMDESSKDISPPSPANRLNLPQEPLNEAESDSSDLYSHLHTTGTSDMMTLPSSSEGPRKIKKVARRWRPSRQEPFWNQKVHQTRDLVNQYELPTVELGQVLRRDNLRLMMMSQPSEVKNQLDQLIQDISMEGLNLDEFMEDLQCSHSDSSSENEEQEISDAETSSGKRRKKARKRNYEESMCIFLEEDAPFPDPSPDTLAKGLQVLTHPEPAYDLGWDTSTSSSST